MPKLKHHKVQQNSEDWEELRRGKFTASSFGNLMANKNTAQYKKEIYRVVYERITGESPEFYVNEYMKRGHELEPFARQEYEELTFNEVQDGGFFQLGEFIGCSPDGLVGEEGGIEIKSPAYNTHFDYLLNKALPDDYKWQVQGNLFVTGRKWWDFITYHPKIKTMILRVLPEAEMQTRLKDELDIAIKRAKELEKIFKVA